MDDEEICRKSDWFTTNSKTGESLTKPAPFDQDFYLVLNMVGWSSTELGAFRTRGGIV